MKHVILTRYYSGTITLGLLKVEGIDHEPIYTLENPWRGNQKDISCIPTGNYHCAAFSGLKYQDVYEVRNVPNRSHILIHIGNYAKGTRGCILPGYSVSPDNITPMVGNSKAAMNKLRSLLKQNPFTLNITNMEY